MDVYRGNDYYEYYRDNHKKTFRGRRVRKRFFNGLLRKYYSAVSQIIVYEMFSYYLGNGFGNILITKSDFFNKYYGNKDYNFSPVDWKATFDLWFEDYGTRAKSELVKIPNKPMVYYDSDYAYRWFWDKRTATFLHSEKYYFKPVKGNKVLLGHAINKLSYLDYPNEDEVEAYSSKRALDKAVIKRAERKLKRVKRERKQNERNTK